MTFRCQVCRIRTKPHEKAHRIVVGATSKQYFTATQDRGIVVAEGSEITKELQVCPACYEETREVVT